MAEKLKRPPMGTASASGADHSEQNDPRDNTKPRRRQTFREKLASLGSSPIYQKRSREFRERTAELSAFIVAQRAEIKLKYQRKARERGFDRGKFRLTEISKLAKYRRKQGRDDVDFAAVLADLRANPRRWNARDLGYRVKLTWDERCHLRLSTIRPADLSDEQFKRKQRERVRVLHRLRQRRYDEKNRAKKRAKCTVASETACAVELELLELLENPSATRVNCIFPPLHSSVRKPSDAPISYAASDNVGRRAKRRHQAQRSEPAYLRTGTIRPSIFQASS